MRRSWLAVSRLLVAPLTLLSGAAAGWAESLPPASEIVRKVANTGPALSLRAHGRLTEISADGSRRVYQLSLVQKRMADRTVLLWTVTDPPEARMRILLESNDNRDVAVWRAERDRPAARLTEHQWAEPILGTRLRVEDLIGHYLAWADQRVTGIEPCGKGTCYVLESRPGDPASSSYSVLVTSLVDRQTFVPMLTRKKLRGREPVRQFRCLGTRRDNQLWVSTGQEIKTAGESGSTRIVMTGGSITNAIRDSEVDARKIFAQEIPAK
jgi:hypothetical protein